MNGISYLANNKYREIAEKIFNLSLLEDFKVKRYKKGAIYDGNVDLLFYFDYGGLKCQSELVTEAQCLFIFDLILSGFYKVVKVKV